MSEERVRKERGHHEMLKELGLYREKGGVRKAQEYRKLRNEMNALLEERDVLLKKGSVTGPGEKVYQTSIQLNKIRDELKKRGDKVIVECRTYLAEALKELKSKDPNYRVAIRDLSDATGQLLYMENLGQAKSFLRVIKKEYDKIEPHIPKYGARVGPYLAKGEDRREIEELGDAINSVGDEIHKRLATHLGLESKMKSRSTYLSSQQYPYLSAIIAISGLVLSIFFLSSNFTGNVIGLNQTSSNWTGIVLFLVGIVGAFWYFKSK